MDFISYKKIKYYEDCAPLVEGLGFVLVDLKIIPTKNVTKISAVIASKDPAQNIGVNDCAKVHRALLTRLEALLGTEETTFMEKYTVPTKSQLHWKKLMELVQPICMRT